MNIRILNPRISETVMKESMKKLILKNNWNLLTEVVKKRIQNKPK